MSQMYCHLMVYMRIVLTTLVTITCLLGDNFVELTQHPLLRALVDNATHAVIGALSGIAFVVQFYDRTSNIFGWLLIFICFSVSSLIDVDHFVEARSWNLEMLGTALLGKRAPKSGKKKPLTEVELKDLRTAFDLLDRNRDGRVTANELQFMLKNLGINVRDELIDDLIKEASHTGNGLIDETEFLQWVGRIQALRDETEESTSKTDELDDVTEDLIAAFRVFDRDGNGFITQDELQTAMEMIGESLTEAQLSQLLAIADLDKDGKINYEEFTRLLL